MEKELKEQLEAIELKKDEDFKNEFYALCEKYRRDFTFVYEAGVVGQPLKGKFTIVRR